MLIQCVECELQVSDKAVSCPHCGYPMRSEKSRISSYKSRKRKRLPNGFGQISEIKGRNLRKPFRVMITVGKDEFGKPICKLLEPVAYFESYNDAFAALVEFNKNPYDFSPDLTLRELYEEWSRKHFTTLKNQSSIRTITSAWRYCSSIHSMKVSDIRSRHIKGAIENASITVDGEIREASAVTKTKIKSMMNTLFDYALENDMVDKNYSRIFSLDKTTTEEVAESKRDHMKFSDEEMEILWKNENSRYVDMIIFQCYSGWRPQEIGLLKIESIDLDKGLMVGGMKTDAGTFRIVPIHSRIEHIVKRNYENAIRINSEYLFNFVNERRGNNSTFFTYDRFAKEFRRIRDKLGLDPKHQAHDGRKHFVSMCKRYNVDQFAIKRMVGHSITDITEKVYTQRDNDWFKSEIEKVK